MNRIPPIRVFGLMLVYGLDLCASLWLGYELRFDFDVEPHFAEQRFQALLWIVPVKLVLLAAFHQLTPLPGYFSVPDVVRLTNALCLGALVAWLARFFNGVIPSPPRGVIAIDLMLSLIGLAGVRMLLRTWRETRRKALEGEKQVKRVAIIGAGDCGAILAKELYMKSSLGLEPVAFFDDDRRKTRSRLHNIPVLGPPEKLLEWKDKLRVDQAVIAMPSAPAKRVGEIVRTLRAAGIKVRTVPSLDQLALGQVRVSKLRDVEMHELLGRDRVDLESHAVRRSLQDRVVLVTGAGGSIGSELCRQIAACGPERLLLVERSEPQMFQIEQELVRIGYGHLLRPFVTDILDKERVAQILSEFRPAVIFHAAAHKHVPMMESQPVEAIRNNSLGTAQLAELAIRFEVEKFVLISTDKAVNPTSVMGATKRLAEIYIQALQGARSHRTRFMAVRFGNVLGSSGSVIPIFRRQIAEGGPVQVTHPEVTRYFMTIPEAAQLVLQSAAQGNGGEIFVLDMGKPIKILELARHMIELSGLRPEEDIEIEFTGLRPGEKLFEETVADVETTIPTHHPKIRCLVSEPRPLSEVRQAFEVLSSRLFQARSSELKMLLNELVPEYTPDFGRTAPEPLAEVASAK